MPWVDKVPNCDLRQNCQTVIFALAEFHKFCKPDTWENFRNIGESATQLVKAIFSEQPPQDVEIANIVNVINTQLSVINRAKKGNHNATEFRVAYAQITALLQKLSDHSADAINQYKEPTAESAKDEHKTDTTHKLRQGLLLALTEQDLTDQIAVLYTPPKDPTVKDRLRAAFFKRPGFSITGLGFTGLGLGALSQTGMNAFVKFICEKMEVSSDFPTEIVWPAVCATFAIAFCATAMRRSAPKAPPTSESKEIPSAKSGSVSIKVEGTAEGLSAPLLAVAAASSDAPALR